MATMLQDAASRSAGDLHATKAADPRRSTRRRRPTGRALRLLAWLVVASVGMLPAGCVHRRLTIRSDPPGAHVSIDGEELGITPVSTDFTYYGTHEITLTKSGFETLTVMQPVPTPWYQIPPLDLIADNFWPFSVTNRHEFTYRLTPRQPPSTEALLERARELRSESQLGIP